MSQKFDKRSALCVGITIVILIVCGVSVYAFTAIRDDLSFNIWFITGLQKKTVELILNFSLVAIGFIAFLLVLLACNLPKCRFANNEEIALLKSQIAAEREKAAELRAQLDSTKEELEDCKNERDDYEQRWNSLQINYKRPKEEINDTNSTLH